MVERFNRVPDFKTVYAEGDRGPQDLNPVAENQTKDTPQNYSARVKEFALQHEADLVGIANMNPDWCYDDCGSDIHPWIIVLGAALDIQP